MHLAGSTPRTISLLSEEDLAALAQSGCEASFENWFVACKCRW